MDTLTAQRLDDLVTTTLQELGRDELIQIAQSQTGYEIYSYWFAKERIAFDEGVGIQRTLMNRLGDTAKFQGLGEVDNVNIRKLLTKMNLPWRHCSTSWAYELREMMMNKGKARINNVIKPRRSAAVLDLIEVIETSAWAAAPPTSDESSPWGIRYWVVPNASEGFNGGAPAGHTTVAGVDLTATPTFKNYTNQYTTVNKADLIRKMRRGHRRTKWRSPISIAEARTGTGRRCRYYMNIATLEEFENVGESQNENLGRDLAPMDGKITFHGHPLVWVEQLDDDTTNPVFGIDHEFFKVVALKADWMRESGPEKVAGQHNMRAAFIDCTLNFMCDDRRRQQVFAKAG